MSVDSDTEAVLLEDIEDVMNRLLTELQKLYEYRDLFFENHDISMASEKNKCVEQKKNELVEKFEAIDVETQIPFSHRAKFLYMKGRCYNINPTYDPRAIQCLSKAVKLNPHLVDAWNELGECYWKNMNVKEAKASFEGALKHERNRLALRCLSIILRREIGQRKTEAIPAVLKSVELAKEAVSQNIKDGVSWSVLGNAYLCQFFTVAQDPATLKLCMSAYKQAALDPISKGQPDLYYNKGIALKYEEKYEEAIENFEYACTLEPLWQPPRLELNNLSRFLQTADRLVNTRGKLKTKKLTSMVQSTDKKMLGVYNESTVHKLSNRDVTLQLAKLSELTDGNNEGKVVLTRVVGSIHNESSVPFTFAIIDESMECVLVTVYNWADGRGAIIGDVVAIPEPSISTHSQESPVKYSFKSIRVNNPMLLLLNGKRVGRNQLACTRVTSTYEVQ